MTPPGELTNRYWKLTELDGRPVVVGEGREPHLRFQAADSHVAGSTGCNSLSGTFERHGDRLSLGRMVTTPTRAILRAISSLGTSPTIRSTSFPCSKTSSVGIASMWY